MFTIAVEFFGAEVAVQHYQWYQDASRISTLKDMITKRIHYHRDLKKKVVDHQNDVVPFWPLGRAEARRQITATSDRCTAATR